MRTLLRCGVPPWGPEALSQSTKSPGWVEPDPLQTESPSQYGSHSAPPPPPPFFFFKTQGFPLGKHRAFSNEMHLGNADPVRAL